MLLSIAFHIDSSRRLSGLAEGVSSIIHCAVRQEWSSVAGCSGLGQFEPRYIALLSANTDLLSSFICFVFVYNVSLLYFTLYLLINICFIICFLSVYTIRNFYIMFTNLSTFSGV